MAKAVNYKPLSLAECLVEPSRRLPAKSIYTEHDQHATLAISTCTYHKTVEHRFSRYYKGKDSILSWN
jgi:hypothetical protein